MSDLKKLPSLMEVAQHHDTLVKDLSVENEALKKELADWESLRIALAPFAHLFKTTEQVAPVWLNKIEKPEKPLVKQLDYSTISTKIPNVEVMTPIEANAVMQLPYLSIEALYKPKNGESQVFRHVPTYNQILQYFNDNQIVGSTSHKSLFKDTPTLVWEKQVAKALWLVPAQVDEELSHFIINGNRVYWWEHVTAYAKLKKITINPVFLKQHFYRLVKDACLKDYSLGWVEHMTVLGSTKDLSKIHPMVCEFEPSFATYKGTLGEINIRNWLNTHKPEVLHDMFTLTHCAYLGKYCTFDKHLNLPQKLKNALTKVEQ